MTQRQKKREPAAWQERGYRMEDAECEHEPPINDQNDTGYLHGDRDACEGDPFDDSAVDEQLRLDRSADLEARKSEFWDDPQRPPEGSGIERVRKKSTALEKVKDTIRSLNIRVTVGFVAALVLLVAITLVTVNLSLRVRTVHVTMSGDTDLRYAGEPTAQVEEQILHLIGGRNIRKLDEDSIRREIAKDPYLSMISVSTDMPGTVNVSVRVRNACATVLYLGNRYTIDSAGMVLETLGPSVQPALPEARLGVYKCNAGKRIELKSAQDMEIYYSVSVELKALGLTKEVEMYDLTNADNLMLKMRDGYYVSLGSSERIHAKLRSMMLVRQKLIETGRTGGTIHVATPEKPTWSP